MDKERANHAGRLLEFIYLLTPQLRRFTVRQCQIIHQSPCQFLPKEDFLQILHFLQNHFNNVFISQDYYKQRRNSRIISQAILTRNRICHQDFLAMHYIDALRKLKTLALIIDCERELIDKINDEFQRVSGSRVPLTDDRIGEFRAQMDNGLEYKPQGVDYFEIETQGDEGFQFVTSEQAIKYYSEQIFRHVNNASLYYQRSIYEYELKQYDLALEDLEDAVDLDQSQKRYRELRNHLLFQLKRELNCRPLFYWLIWLFDSLVQKTDSRNEQLINKINHSNEAINIGASFYYGEDDLEMNMILAQKCWSKVRREQDHKILNFQSYLIE